MVEAGKKKKERKEEKTKVNIESWGLPFIPFPYTECYNRQWLWVLLALCHIPSVTIGNNNYQTPIIYQVLDKLSMCLILLKPLK